MRKFRDADAMLTAGKYQSTVLQSREVSKATYHRWLNRAPTLYVGLAG